MASIRNLKKDINFISSELVIECFTHNFLFPQKNEDELSLIILDTVKMKEEMIKQINEVSTTEANPVKKQFKKIRKELNESLEKIVSRLENLEKE
ncbi:MAG: hypothetical protein JEZ09_20105 [Salinivirgaceae bacterium]|nr:hypothetical protein [Salinivirgaceae bacterium]